MEEHRASRAAYERWHQALGFEPAAETPWRRMLAAHLDPARDLAGKRVLEVGCGRGEIACWLAAREEAPEVLMAADLALAAVSLGSSRARAEGAGAVRWGIADIERLPHPEASFDTVVSCETIEHVPDPARAVRELARVLKPGGRLFLTTPNYLNASGLYRGYLRLSGRRFSEAGQPINNLVLLPRTCAWVRRAGLAIRAVDGVGHYLPLVPGRPALELPALERFRGLTRWFAIQTLVLAEKPWAT